MLRKGILLFVFLILIAGAISCSVWRQLGKMPNDKELSDFVSSEHFNQDKQIFENCCPELIEDINKARAVTDFPHSDSPIIPSLSPKLREKLRSSTTVNRRFRCFRKT